MAVTVATVGNRAVFTNDDGAWHVWLRPVRDPSTGNVVGPGHVGRVVAADGAKVVDDFLNADRNLNDAGNGGLGSFGCHLARRNEHFPDGNVYNYTWNFTSRMAPARDHGFGVCRTRVLQQPVVGADGVGRLTIELGLCDMVSRPKPIFLVRHTYSVYDGRVEDQVDVAASWDGAGPKLFVKEPKLTCHGIGASGPSRYRYLSVFSAEGETLRDSFDIWSLPSCTVKTLQLGGQTRCRLEFRDEAGERPLTVVAKGFGAAGHEPWVDGAGLDAWARDANALERLVPTCNGAYCLQGPADANGAPTLSRNWELGRFASAGRNSAPDPARPAVGVGLHAWEGGSGYPDCLCASRGLPPFGTTYRAWLCYSLSDGWIA